MGKELRKVTEEEMMDIPDNQAIVTLKGYVNAFSVLQGGNAYLLPLNEEYLGKVKFEQGKLKLQGAFEYLNDIEIQKMVTLNYLDKINFPLLRTLYSVFLKAYENNDYIDTNFKVVINIPTLFKALGLKGNRSQEQVRELLQQIEIYKKMMGVILMPDGKHYFPLIGYKYLEENNALIVESPYMKMLVKYMHCISIQKDKNGKTKQLSNGNPSLRPSHSYLIKQQIARERNKTAVENVNIIITLIEQAGNSIPHICAKTIIERNILMKQQLQNCLPKNRQRVLERTFSKTWELLREMTYLEEKYPGIVLPDKEDIPKLKKVKETVYKFPHNGKKK